jgi:GntR family transcriptional regulator, carbon starvation induced regulator
MGRVAATTIAAMSGDLPATSASLAGMAFQRLRFEIIRGLLTPGQKLHIKELADRYGTGITPIREALNRLSRDGLVEHGEQRGFTVCGVSEDHLEELTRTRGWLYEIGLRESITYGDAAWEESVVVAHHRMCRFGSDQQSAERDAAHRHFHSVLIGACRSRWLVEFSEQLFDAAERYRYLARVSKMRPAIRKGDEHKAMVDAVLSRDSDKAVALLTAHITKTADLVRGRCGELSGATSASGNSTRKRAVRSLVVPRG